MFQQKKFFLNKYRTNLNQRGAEVVKKKSCCSVRSYSLTTIVARYEFQEELLDFISASLRLNAALYFSMKNCCLEDFLI